MTARANLPLAVRLGLIHVGITEFSDGWRPVLWTPYRGPRPYGSGLSRALAADLARALATLDPWCVLDLPPESAGDEAGLIHVLRSSRRVIVVMHESRSGDSWELLDRFHPNDVQQAIDYALSQCEPYRARLGRIVAPFEDGAEL